MRQNWAFFFDGKQAADGRAVWDDAVQDAVNAGQCERVGKSCIITKPLARIRRIYPSDFFTAPRLVAIA